MQINSINNSLNFNGAYVVKGQIKDTVELSERITDRGYSYSATYIDGKLSPNSIAHLLITTGKDESALHKFTSKKKKDTYENFNIINKIFKPKKINVYQVQEVMEALNEHRFDVIEGGFLED